MLIVKNQARLTGFIYAIYAFTQIIKLKLTAMKKLLVIICFGFAMSLNAQVSSYLNKGESGAGVIANYESGYGFDGVFGVFSYSHKGILDLSVCLSQSYFNEWEEGTTNPDATDFYYSGEVSWWVIREKPTQGIEVNFALNLGLEAANYKDYTFIGGSYDGYYGGWIGFNANVNFNLPNKWTLQPNLIHYYGFGYDRNSELVGGVATNTKDFYRGTGSMLGVSLQKKLNSGNSLIFSFMQGLSNYNNFNIFDVGVGYVIALK